MRRIFALKKWIKTIFLCVVICLFSAGIAFGQSNYRGLTGVWRGNDGASYYIREFYDSQGFHRVAWFGRGREFANVLFGSIPRGENHISGDWVDIPIIRRQ